MNDKDKPVAPGQANGLKSRVAITVAVALVASLIECKIVLVLQTRIQPHFIPTAVETVALGSTDLGNELVFHAALCGTRINRDADSQLVVGLENRLADQRYVSKNPWDAISIRVTDPGGHETSWPLLGFNKIPAAAPKLPEMLDPLDAASEPLGELALQRPHQLKVWIAYFYRQPPSWETFRRGIGIYHVLTQPGRYRLRIIYQDAGGARTLCDYPNLTVE